MSAIRECVGSITAQEGWTMKRLAEELGIHYEKLRRIKKGTYKEPPFALICDLFRLARRSIDEVVGIECPQDSTEGGAPGVAPEELAELRRTVARQERIIDRLVETPAPDADRGLSEIERIERQAAEEEWLQAREYVNALGLQEAKALIESVEKRQNLERYRNKGQK